MRLYLPSDSSTYKIDYEGATIPLPLVTSVAFYEAKLFRKNSKWQVIEDSAFLKQLIQSTLQTSSKESLESLIRMEQYYMEVNGNIPVGTPEDQASKIRERRNSSDKDIYTRGLKADETTFNSIITDSPTLGQLVDENRYKNGQNKNKWRKKEKKKKKNLT